MDSLARRILGFVVIGAMTLIQLPQRLLSPMKSVDAKDVMLRAENCSTADRCEIIKSSKGKEA